MLPTESHNPGLDSRLCGNDNNDVIDRFKALCPIANPSGQEAALREFIQTELTALGLTDQRVDSIGNLVARIPGRAGLSPWLLSAHMDSVPVCEGIVPREVVQPDGTVALMPTGETILGADDKAGIACMLTLMTTFAAQGFTQNRPLILYFSVQEEIGLQGAKALDWDWVSEATWAWVLDGDGPVGDIYTAGPFQEALKFEVKGKRAHAGICPEQGLNAIRVLAEWLAACPNGRLSPTGTTNVGKISGGDATNVVPDWAEALGEARGLTEPELVSIVDSVQAACDTVAQRYPDAGLSLTHTRKNAGFTVDHTHAEIALLQQVFTAAGIANGCKPMAIGSDAHILNARGLPAVVVGMGFTRSHTRQEILYCEPYRQLTQCMITLLCDSTLP